MKIEIEIPDNAEVFSDYDLDRYIPSISANTFGDKAAALAISCFVDNLYDEYSDATHGEIHNEVTKIIANHKEQIIKDATEKVAQEMLRRKEIASQLPKKSELKNINKEWTNFFMELIDKAIAKKFK